LHLCPLDWLSDALWFGGAFVIVLAHLLVWRLARRAFAEEEPSSEDAEVPAAASDRT